MHLLHLLPTTSLIGRLDHKSEHINQPSTSIKEIQNVTMLDDEFHALFTNAYIHCNGNPSKRALLPNVK